MFVKRQWNEAIDGQAGTETPALSHGAVFEANRRALRHLLDLQGPNGDWEGEMVWCTMILAQAVIVRTIVGRPYGDAEKARIILYFEKASGTTVLGVCTRNHRATSFSPRLVMSP